MRKLISTTGQCISEFIGTCLIIFFGTGCIAAMKLAHTALSQWEISIIWGMGVAMAIYLTSSISGAHLNPAVTIALWLFAKFDRKKVLPYIIAQMLGSFFTTGIIYGFYYNLILHYEKIHHIVRGSIESLDLASIFSTYPNNYISVPQAFMLETVITAILLCLILALTDKNNLIYSKTLSPFLIGILISVIGSSTGNLSGFAMNPARDFSPKTFAFLAGWGKIAYTGGRNIPYFLVPLIAPIFGACIGVYIYKKFISYYFPINLINKNNNIE